MALIWPVSMLSRNASKLRPCQAGAPTTRKNAVYTSSLAAHSAPFSTSSFTEPLYYCARPAKSRLAQRGDSGWKPGLSDKWTGAVRIEPESKLRDADQGFPAFGL